MDKNNIVYIETSTWSGISPGAIHIYAELRCNGESISLTKKLSARSAATVNKSREGLLYRPFKAGDDVDFFDSYEEIEKIALRQWKKEFPDAEILILGSASACDPQKVLFHPTPNVIIEANQLYDEFESFEGYQYKKNWPKAEEIQEQWDRLLELD